MHYKPKSVAALQIVLGGLPGRMRVEVDRGVKLSATTVSQLRAVAVWPENLAVSTPPLPNSGCVKVTKASAATRMTPKP